eukprot:gene21450-27483_t
MVKLNLVNYDRFVRYFSNYETNHSITNINSKSHRSTNTISNYWAIFSCSDENTNINSKSHRSTITIPDYWTIFSCSNEKAYVACSNIIINSNNAWDVFKACGGTKIIASGCNSCTGDQLLQLRSLSGAILSSDDDGCGVSGSCSKLTYIVPGNSTVCNTYTLNEGCYQALTCGGTVSLSGMSGDFVPTPTATPFTTSPSAKSTIPTVIPSSSKIPTARPTTLVPTPVPSTRYPTALPTSPFNTTYGIVSGKSIAELTAEGFTVCYDQPYSTATTSTALLTACNTETAAMLFVGSKSSSSDAILSLGAYGLASDVFSATYSTSTAVLKNGVYWYFYVAFGFADSSYIVLNQADTVSPSAFRLSWLLNVVSSGGGYRSGNTLGLTYDTKWRKVIYKRAPDWVAGTPSKQPTLIPSKMPTRVPTFSIPSVTPTKTPTLSPTQRPSTRGPTVPAGSPTRLPTQTPLSPTRVPTGRPSFAPSIGVTWIQSLTSPLAHWLSLATSSNGKYLTATTSALGLYYSSDYGESWARSDAPKCTYTSVTNTESGQISIAVCSGSYVGAYMSSNYGRNWTAMSYTVSGSRRMSAVELDEMHTAAVPSGIVLTSVVISSSGLYIYGVTNTGGLMASSNSGGSFTLRTVLGFTASKIFSDRSGAYVIIIDTAGCAWSSSTFTSSFNKLGTECVGYTAVTIANPYVVLAYANTGYVKQSRNFGGTWATYSVSTLNTNIVTAMSVDSEGMYVAAITSSSSDCIYVSNTFGTSWACYPSSPLSQWTTISMGSWGYALVAGGQSSRLYAMTVTDGGSSSASSEGSSFSWDNGAGSGVIAAIVIVAFAAVFAACYCALRLECCRPVSPDANLVANTEHTEDAAGTEAGDFALATAISEHDVESLKFANDQGGKGSGSGGGREMVIGEYIAPSAPPLTQQYEAVAVDDVEADSDHRPHEAEHHSSPQSAVAVDHSDTQVHYDLPAVPTKPVMLVVVGRGGGGGGVVPAVLVQEQSPYVDQTHSDEEINQQQHSHIPVDETWTEEVTSVATPSEEAQGPVEERPVETQYTSEVGTDESDGEPVADDQESSEYLQQQAVTAADHESTDQSEPEQVVTSAVDTPQVSPEREVPPVVTVTVEEEAVVLISEQKEQLSTVSDGGDLVQNEKENGQLKQRTSQHEVKTFCDTSHDEVEVVIVKEEEEEVHPDYSNM